MARCEKVKKVKKIKKVKNMEKQKVGKCGVCGASPVPITTITEIDRAEIEPVCLCESCLGTDVRRSMVGMVPLFLVKQRSSK